MPQQSQPCLSITTLDDVACTVVPRGVGGLMTAMLPETFGAIHLKKKNVVVLDSSIKYPPSPV